VSETAVRHRLRPSPGRWLEHALVAILVVGLRGVASAADWGGIVPGETTVEVVRARFGEPTSATKQKLEKYDSLQWTYEGARAPAGLIRMVVHFGILKPAGFQPGVVRTFRLEPKRGVFTRRAILLGWGKPDQAGNQDGVPVMIYRSGLTVYFDKDILEAVSMWFTAPLPNTAPAQPRR
jgi:hypothetical protein